MTAPVARLSAAEDRAGSAAALDLARQILRDHGHSAISATTLWPGNQICFGPRRASYISYRVTDGVALAVGDPIGPSTEHGRAIDAFRRHCAAQGWRPAFYHATPFVLPQLRERGYRALKIGEAGFIPLPNLAFRGKAWADLRRAFNRAEREGITFHLDRGGSLPPLVRQQIAELSAQWLRNKGLPEMGFTLGRTEQLDDPTVQVAVAIEASGRLAGFVDWLPMYAIDGWTIDLMRRRTGAFHGLMEFLIGSSLLAFQARGCQVAGLGLAPLANPSREAPDSPLQSALDLVFQHVDTFYRFQSLYAFKKKFQPRWRNVYLAYPSHRELPRVALAVSRAYLPDLSPRLVARLVGGTLLRQAVRPLGPRSGAA